MPEEKSAKKKTVAYVPFKTFLSSIESLSHGVPNIIHRSMWQNYSGIVQSQVLGAYRFLGLVFDDGKPTTRLIKLVEEPERRQENIRELLKTSYPELIALELTKTIPASFNGVMEGYGIRGDTLKKASAFFLHAARYSDLPLSPYLLRQSRSTTTGRKRKTTKRGEGTRRHIETKKTRGQPTELSLTGGPSKVVMLGNNVKLTLTASADTFKMTSEDRRFLLELLDKLEQYEAKRKPALSKKD